MSYTICKLNNASYSHEEIEELRAVFDLAFASGTSISIDTEFNVFSHLQILAEHGFKCVVGPDNFDRVLPVLNRSQIVAGTLGGEIYLAKDEDGKIIGGIICEDQRKQALAPLMASLPDDVKAWFAGSVALMEEFKRKTFGDMTKTEWYLQRVGVHPDWQGKGVGTALIERGRQNTNGHAIALQAVEPANIGYYEHIGFKNKGHIDVQAPHGDFTVTGLLWQP
ncbi:hypothetical protein H0H93_006073 [Arthromyces matolae]|nr:hypothetical protein H0H93_006073 [Arthromyces matolae]